MNKDPIKQKEKSGNRSIPMVEEVATVAKHAVEGKRITVERSVTESTEMVRETLSQENITIERRPCEQIVESPPPVTENNGITIIPVVEERIKVIRELVVVEEIIITKTSVAQNVEVPVDLRKTSVTIAKDDAS